MEEQMNKNVEKELQKLKEKYPIAAAELKDDERFDKLCNHPNLKRVTTNEKDGGFTFWF